MVLGSEEPLGPTVYGTLATQQVSHPRIFRVVLPPVLGRRATRPVRAPGFTPPVRVGGGLRGVNRPTVDAEAGVSFCSRTIPVKDT